MKNRENYIQGLFVKIQEFTLVIVFMIFPQKLQFRLKNENFENFSEFSLFILFSITTTTTIVQVDGFSRSSKPEEGHEWR